ncbi:MAG: protein kinase [Candidatus Zixiibacteriota bacterium]|nr:MAG: protein kinase [candidate division Zixibacteria bacterium]
MSQPRENGMDNTRSFIPLSEGTLISHYKIIKKIGVGGMGEVYLAEDTKLNRRVALKFLPPHLCPDEDCRKRFKLEAQAAAKLDHPNIIHVYEVGEFKGRPYFAMQHVEGRSLRDFASEKELSVEQILELGIQICEGLNDAHEKGVTHRDIKPSNILIDSHGRAKIVDFGLASVVGSDQLTKTGSTLGTIGYMSPEQVQGKEIDHRSDLFSLGVVLYELITEQNPFKRDSEAATLKAVSDDTPHPVSRYRADVPEGLQAIIGKALEKDPALRCQSAEEFVADIKRVQRDISSKEFQVAGNKLVLPPFRKKVSRFVIPTSVIAILVLLFLIFKSFRFEISSRHDIKAGIESLAVLYFENLKDPDDAERLGQIMQELVITDLSELSSIKVLSSQRLFDVQKKMGYKNRTKIDQDISIEVARRAGADKLLSGSLMQLGGKWVLTCQLVDVEDGLVIKSQRIDGLDLYGMVDDLASQVRTDLSLPIDAGDRVEIAVRDKTTQSMDAYRHYLDGVDYINIGSMDSAIASLEMAVEIDPDFNQAYYRLAFAQWWARDISSQQGVESITRILEGKKYTTERERRLAEGALAMFENRFTDAVNTYEQMVESHPDDKEIHFVLGLAYSNESAMNQNKALAAFQKAIDLDLTYVPAHQEIYDLYIRDRNYVKAMKQARDIITIKPDGLMGYRFMVGAALSKGDTDQIDLALEQAIQQHKTPEEIKGLYLYMSQTGNRIGDQNLSEIYARKALEYDSTDWLAWALLGDALGNQSKLTRSGQAFEKGLELNPDNTWCLGGLWYISLAEREYDKAIEYSQKLVKIRPQSPRRYGELYESYSLNYQIEAADSILEVGLQAIPSLPGKAHLLGHAANVNERKLNNRRKAEQLLLRAEALDITGTYDMSTRSYNIYRGLAGLYISTRNYDKAEYYADKALEMDSLDGNAIGFKFYSSLYRGSYEHAFAYAHKQVEIKSHVGDAYGNLIEAFIVTGQYEKADSVLAVAVEVDPMVNAKARILRRVAEMYINVRELIRAERLCERSASYFPGSWKINQTLGWIYELQGKYDEAEQVYSGLFELGQGRGFEPDPLQDYLQMSRLFMRQKDYVEAEKWFNRCLEIDMYSSTTFRFFGYMYCDQQKYDKARQYAEQALKYDSTFFSYTLMARVLIEGGLDNDQGIQLAQLAIKHPPEDDLFDTYLWTKPYVTLPQHILGLAYMKKQDYRRALEYLQEAAALRPDDKDISREILWIESRLGSL